MAVRSEVSGNKKGSIRALAPLDFTSLVKFDGFEIKGAEPEKTRRKAVFQVDGVWNKLTVDEEGIADMEECPTQEVTEDSVLTEGTPVADLLKIKDLSVLAGFKAYPLIAMSVDDGEKVPDISMSANWISRQDGMSTMNKVFGICIDHMGDPANGFKQINADGNPLTSESIDPHVQEYKFTDEYPGEDCIGVSLLREGGGNGTWACVDGYGNILEKQNLKSVYDFDAIQPIVIDGQHMVRIPKFYIKVGYPIGKKKTSGTRTIWISSKPKEGFHIHPAFVKDNKVMNCFYYGAYEASAEKDLDGKLWDSTGNTKLFTDTKACSLPNVHPWNYVYIEESAKACLARNTGEEGSEQSGWHLQTIYEGAAISLLMLVEFGATNVADLTGYGNIGKKYDDSSRPHGVDYSVYTGTSDSVWRGIHELCGDLGEYVDGGTVDKYGNLSIFNHKMNGTYCNAVADLPYGGKTVGNSGGTTAHRGYVVKLHDDSGIGFDLKDILYPAELVENPNGSIHEGAFICQADFKSQNDILRQKVVCIMHSGFGATKDNVGCLVTNSDCDYSISDLGFRIAKIGNITDEIAFVDEAK